MINLDYAGAPSAQVAISKSAAAARTLVRNNRGRKRFANKRSIRLFAPATVEQAAMTKHPKSKTPSERDLEVNPLIGASKGMTMAGADAEDLEAIEGANTIEGDRENDVNASGGIDKGVSRAGHPVEARRRSSRTSGHGVRRDGGKKQVGAGTQGKGAGSGAATELPAGAIPENVVLSNRDKSQHTDQRGLDSKWVQTEQLQDHSANRLDEPEAK